MFARRSGRDTPDGASHGADIHARAVLTFEEAWHGVARAVTVTRHDACRTCEGSGYQRVAETRCVACEGSGAVRSVRGHMVFSKNCPTLRRRRAAQAGAMRRVPWAGRRAAGGDPDGPDAPRASTRARACGSGARDTPGVRGGAPGDLFVDVEVQEHPVYRREGDELHMTVPIAIHEAALGAKIDVPTPDGPARLRVPPGTQSGQRFRLRERGAVGRTGRRGDLVVDVRMRLPKVLDERSKELLREFGRINGESVREP